MDKYDKDLAIDNFISSLEHDLYNIKLLCKFFNIEDERCRKLVDDSIKLIDKKIKEIKNSKSLEDVKKHVKLKKVFKEYGDKNGKK